MEIEKMAKILITENERIVAEDLKFVLQSFGHKVITTTATGENAVKIAAEKKPDIIFMDINLDGKMNGIEAARKIAKQQNVMLIFCSAYNDDHTLLRASALNPVGYISKPFDLDEIEELMNFHTRSYENNDVEDFTIKRDVYQKKIS